MVATPGEPIEHAAPPPAWARKQFISMSDGLKAHLRRALKFREVSLVTLSPGLRTAKHVLVTTVHNEAPRIRFILKYYRDMGFEQFIVIDNRSDDGLRQILATEPGISLFSANGSFKDSRFGCDWVNGILAKYCAQKWVLYIDADEFFVFPHCDTKNIRHLTDFLERTKQPSLQCMMLDMYSDKDAQYNQCAEGQNPVSICRFYDRDGYVKKYAPVRETVWIKGGVRGRVYFANNLWEGPALNKTPLVFWKRHYAFLKATHELWPYRLNGGPPGQKKLRGILLHFKFLADWTKKIATESARQQHTEEYKAYTVAATADRESGFVGIPTSEYTGWRALAHDGLLDATAWPV